MDKLFLINSNCKVDNMEENRKTRTIGTNTENNHTQHTICPCHQQCYQHQMYYVPCCVPHFNCCSASPFMPVPYPRDINEHRCVCRKSCCGDYTFKCQCIHAFQQCSKMNECKLKTDMIENNKTVSIDKSQEIPLLLKPSVSNIVNCTTKAKIARSDESIETCLNYEHENKKNQDNIVLYDMHQYANKLLMKMNEKDDKNAKKNYVEERKLLEDLLTPTNQFSISKSSMDSEEDSDDCIEVDNNEEFELDKYLQNTSTKLITKGETEIIQHKSIECQRTKTISTKNEGTNTSKNKFTDVAMLMMIKTLMEDQNKSSKNSHLNKILNHIGNN